MCYLRLFHSTVNKVHGSCERLYEYYEYLMYYKWIFIKYCHFFINIKEMPIFDKLWSSDWD